MDDIQLLLKLCRNCARKEYPGTYKVDLGDRLTSSNVLELMGSEEPAVRGLTQVHENHPHSGSLDAPLEQVLRLIYEESNGVVEASRALFMLGSLGLIRREESKYLDAVNELGRRQHSSKDPVVCDSFGSRRHLLQGEAAALGTFFEPNLVRARAEFEQALEASENLNLQPKEQYRVPGIQKIVLGNLVCVAESPEDIHMFWDKLAIELGEVGPASDVDMVSFLAGFDGYFLKLRHTVRRHGKSVRANIRDLLGPVGVL
ncbi:MAG: hypothetical protein R3C01_07755 [Planctomycetaceae bacterium]